MGPRPIFCGNFEFDARQGELERLFRKYGKVDRVDMKSGFAFVYMEDERDAEDAIRALDRYEFGRKGRRLRVEWTKQERNVRQPVISRKSSSNSRPSKTLFVINFDPYNTRTRDLERHFDPFGKILNIRIRRNFAFIQFELQEDATKALESTNLSKLMDRVISVEYAIKDDDARKNGSPNGGRDRSPRRRGDDRGSPYRRDRGSPDYGRGRERGSPDYGRGGRGRSPSPPRRDRGSPSYGRDASPPLNGKDRNTDYRRDSSASPNGRVRKVGRGDASPSPRRDRERSPRHGRGSIPKERVSPEYEQGAIISPRDRRDSSASPNGRVRKAGRREASPSPRRDRERSSRHGRGSIPKERVSPEYEHGAIISPRDRRDSSASPNGMARKAGRREASPSPRRDRERSSRHGHGSIPKERVSPEYEQGAIISPRDEGRISDSPREASPPVFKLDSPNYGGDFSPPERYRSRSPARDRSRS